MDLVFAAEQYAQAQAAVAAAAQYYTNAAISAANGPMAPTAPIIVTSAAGQLGLIQAQAVAAAAAGHHTAPSIISGTQVLGPQFLNTALATAAPLPQAPPPPPISIQTPGNNAINQRIGLVSVGSESEKRMTHDSDNRDRRRDNRVRVDRDHRSERERGSDRESYRSDRYSKYDRDRDRDRDRRGDRDRNHDKRDRDDRRRRDRSPGRRNRSRSPYRRDRDRDCTPESDDTDKDIPPNNTIMVRGLAQHISETDIEDSIHGCGLQAKDIRLIRKKETGTVIDFLVTGMP